MKLVLQIIFIFSLINCSSGLHIIHKGTTPQEPWSKPYVDGMNGVENLAFDGKGSLFVTGLDGYIYRIEPTEDPFKGKITAKKKIGDMCLGIIAGSDDMLYVGVKLEKGVYKIAKLSKDFTYIKYLTNNTSGLNGFAKSSDDYLYYTSSNVNVFFPKGKIYRVKLGDDDNFKNPEIVVDNAGLVNGLAFSKDESILYYTELLNGVWSFDLKNREKKKIYSPRGFFQVIDDITTSEDGRVWFCFNSEEAIVPIENEKAKTGYRIGELGAPSSCEFGKGPGFNPNFLYITEYGLKGRSLGMNGRGVWVFPVAEF